jgi:probable rRNA maturation factor
MTEDTFTLQNKTKGRLPRLPFVRIKEIVLGTEYELSIVFVTPALSRKLNRTHRGKDYSTNILSFPLSMTSGEIIIEPKKVRADAPDFDMDYKTFMGFLVIHGMLHLKGMEHSSTMTKAEKHFMKKCGLA